MSSRPKARWRSLLLLAAILFSTTLPRAFVVCVTEDDHVSLEAVFEGDPCETKFIFGARAETGWPKAACTDIPAVQLSMLADAAPSIDAAPVIVPVVFATAAASTPRPRAFHDPLPPRPLREFQALRTTVLRL
ncbi:MAG: hypothetical protein IPK00_14130 [Deltaproteobacteria bacterium]|nr:hypothetical protein [Deltaproteobacteria bacterium]